MVAGLPGADRRRSISSNISCGDLYGYYQKVYKLFNFRPNPQSGDLTYEMSLCALSIGDIISILDDLIEEKL